MAACLGVGAARTPVNIPWPVVLASASPRRRELLGKLITEFAVDPADIDEAEHADPDPLVTAQRLAKHKCLHVFERHPQALVVAGDTVVAYPLDGGWKQLAKPHSEDDAVEMLMQLAGRTHTVVTGVCLRWPSGMAAFTDSTQVTFRAFAETEARAYSRTGAPLDKAGAYGLQDQSQSFVEGVRGSVTNVIGLPMEKLEESLRSIAGSA